MRFLLFTAISIGVGAAPVSAAPTNLAVVATAPRADARRPLVRPTPGVPVPVVYVDPTGDDLTGDGSATQPFRTLQRAHDVVDSGGTIRARAGAYPFAVSIGKPLTIERDGAGTVTVGPPDLGTVTVTVAADDVSMRDLTFAGGASVQGVLATGDRTTLQRCVFAGTALGAVRFLAPASSGHRLDACTFRDVRAVPAAIAVDARHCSGIVVAACLFRGGDVGVRLEDCAASQVDACEFVDHFQAALVATGSADLGVTRCRFTRCGHFATPARAVAPGEGLGTVSLVAGSDRARVVDNVVEDSGGYLGRDAFRAGATTTFDGLFGLAVLDCADVQVRGCSLHRNRFGGVWVGGNSPNALLERCNLVANGSDDGGGEDVAIYSDGPAVAAQACYFGAVAGPGFDAAGFGNGVLGPVTVTAFAVAPFDAPAFGVVEGRRAAAADRSLALTARDLTGDGWIEVITAGDRTGQVDVLVNAPNAFVARHSVLLSGSEPVALATGLFDADAHADVVALDALGMQAAFLFGDGTGQLGGARSFAVRRRPLALAVGELDGQSGDDVAVACQGDAFGAGGVVVLRNDGSGQFTPVDLAGAVAPCAVVLMDLDGDSDLDVVAFDLDPAGPGLRLWHSDGNGGFGTAAAIAVDAHPVADASLAALQQDGGALDLAVASFQLLPLPGVARVRLFRGDGAGSFAAPIELRQRAGPLLLHVATLGGAVRPSLLAVDRSAREVLVLGPIAADSSASFPYAQTFGETPLQAAVAPITNRSADDLVVAEAASAELVVQRGRRPADVTRYGAGCSGALGVPRALWASLPQLGSATFALAFEGAQPGAPAVFALGAVPLDVPLPGGCRLLVDMLLSLGSAADATGTGTVPLAVPDARELVGASLYGQWFVVDTAGSLFGTLAVTAGLHVRLGG
ncbi:MAG: right-handed parallel beta-helix repeat-containing protein [Planctomycetota bacterium]